MTGQSIRRIRRALGLTQAEFGTLFGLPVVLIVQGAPAGR
jgi:DNA-binding transcriptional regulator YiaG